MLCKGCGAVKSLQKVYPDKMLPSVFCAREQKAMKRQFRSPLRPPPHPPRSRNEKTDRLAGASTLQLCKKREKSCKDHKYCSDVFILAPATCEMQLLRTRLLARSRQAFSWAEGETCQMRRRRSPRGELKAGSGVATRRGALSPTAPLPLPHPQPAASLLIPGVR